MCKRTLSTRVSVSRSSNSPNSANDNRARFAAMIVVRKRQGNIAPRTAVSCKLQGSEDGAGNQTVCEERWFRVQGGESTRRPSTSALKVHNFLNGRRAPREWVEWLQWAQSRLMQEPATLWCFWEQSTSQ